MESYEEIIEDIREDIRNNRFGDAFEKAKEIFKKTTSDDLKEKFDILCSDYNISEEDSAPFPGVKNGIRKRFFLYLKQLKKELDNLQNSSIQGQGSSNKVSSNLFSGLKKRTKILYIIAFLFLAGGSYFIRPHLWGDKKSTAQLDDNKQYKGKEEEKKEGKKEEEKKEGKKEEVEKEGKKEEEKKEGKKEEEKKEGKKEEEKKEGKKGEEKKEGKKGEEKKEGKKGEEKKEGKKGEEKILKEPNILQSGHSIEKWSGISQVIKDEKADVTKRMRKFLNNSKVSSGIPSLMKLRCLPDVEIMVFGKKVSLERFTSTTYTKKEFISIQYVEIVVFDKKSIKSNTSNRADGDVYENGKFKETKKGIFITSEQRDAIRDSEIIPAFFYKKIKLEYK